MKKLFLAISLMAFSVAAFAQCTNGFGSGSQCVGTVTAVDSSCTGTQCLVLPLPANSGLTAVALSGTFTLTLTPEVSADNVNWTGISCSASGGGTTTTFTAVGAWQCATAGFAYFRIRPSAFTSGSANVVLQASGNQAGAQLSQTNTFTAAQSFNGNLNLGTSVNINWTDAAILRDAANIIAHRNGANAQGLRIYNTWTDASNGEWGTLDFTTSANVFTVGTAANGTGAGRTLQLQSSGAANPLNFRTNAALRWQMTSAGHFITAVDNTQDIGASGATRPRTLFVGTSVNAPTYLTTTNCSSAAGTCVAAPAGAVTIAAAATTVTVATTVVTANSQIILTEDSSLGTKLSVTCNTTLGRHYAITTRTAATSFVITTDAAPVTNPACLSYLVVN